MFVFLSRCALVWFSFLFCFYKFHSLFFLCSLCLYFYGFLNAFFLCFFCVCLICLRVTLVFKSFVFCVILAFSSTIRLLSELSSKVHLMALYFHSDFEGWIGVRGIRIKVYLDSVNKIQRQFLEHEEITVRRKRTLCDSSVKTYTSSDFEKLN